MVKSHGSADAKGFANAIKIAADLADSDYMAEIATNLERLSAVSKQAKSEESGPRVEQQA